MVSASCGVICFDFFLSGSVLPSQVSGPSFRRYAQGSGVFLRSLTTDLALSGRLIIISAHRDPGRRLRLALG